MSAELRRAVYAKGKSLSLTVQVNYHRRLQRFGQIAVAGLAAKLGERVVADQPGQMELVANRAVEADGVAVVDDLVVAVPADPWRRISCIDRDRHNEPFRYSYIGSGDIDLIGVVVQQKRERVSFLCVAQRSFSHSCVQ